MESDFSLPSIEKCTTDLCPSPRPLYKYSDSQFFYGTMNPEAADSSEILVPIYHSTRNHTPEYYNLDTAVSTVDLTCVLISIRYVYYSNGVQIYPGLCHF